MPVWYAVFIFIKEGHEYMPHETVPEVYQIRVQEYLDDSWLERFSGLALVHLENGVTQLTCCLTDQSALHGILERIRDMNLTLISVTRLSPAQFPHPQPLE